MHPALAGIPIQKRAKENNCDGNWREHSPRGLRAHADAHTEDHKDYKQINNKKQLIEWDVAQSGTKFEIGSD